MDSSAEEGECIHEEFVSDSMVKSPEGFFSNCRDSFELMLSKTI